MAINRQSMSWKTFFQMTRKSGKLGIQLYVPRLAGNRTGICGRFSLASTDLFTPRNDLDCDDCDGDGMLHSDNRHRYGLIVVHVLL
jgi:hypothetical protein